MSQLNNGVIRKEARHKKLPKNYVKITDTVAVHEIAFWD